MFSPEMLKEAVPMLLASMESNPIQDVERVLTHWFEGKKQRTPLLDGEDELVLMFVLTGQQLLMVPCTVDNSANPVVIRRFLADQGLNVSQFAAKLLFTEVVTLSLAAGSDPRPFRERFMEMLFQAAAHPTCRLVNETPEPVALPAHPEGFALPEDITEAAKRDEEE